MFSKRKHVFLLTFALAGLLAPSVLLAAVKPAPDLQEAALDAARIAKVLVAGEKKTSCGYIYSAVVIDALKGPRTDFSFFSATRLRHGADRTAYLVFANRIDREGRLLDLNYLFSDILSDEQRTVMACRMVSPFYSPSSFEAAIPFERSAGNVGSFEYISFSSRGDGAHRPSILSCEVHLKPFVASSGAPLRYKWTALRNGILKLLQSSPGICDF